MKPSSSKAPTKTNSYHNNRWNFSFSYPADWIIHSENQLEEKGWTIAVILTGEETPEGTSGVNISVREGCLLNAAGMGLQTTDIQGNVRTAQLVKLPKTPREFNERSKSSLRKMFPGITFLVEEECEIAGMPAATLVYTRDEGDIKEKNTTIFGNDNSYQIICEAPIDQFASAEAALNCIMRTFQVNVNTTQVIIQTSFIAIGCTTRIPKEMVDPLIAEVINSKEKETNPAAKEFTKLFSSKSFRDSTVHRLEVIVPQPDKAMDLVFSTTQALQREIESKHGIKENLPDLFNKRVFFQAGGITISGTPQFWCVVFYFYTDGSSKVQTPTARKAKSPLEEIKQKTETPIQPAEAQLETPKLPSPGDLIKVLKGSGKDVRRGAEEMLGKTGNARAVEPLIKALKDRNTYVPKEAAIPFGKIGNVTTQSRKYHSLGTRIQRVWKKPRGKATLIGGALLALIVLGLFLTLTSGTLQRARPMVQDTSTMMSMPTIAKPTSTLANQAPLVADPIALNPTVTATLGIDALPSATPAICATQAVGLVAWWPGEGNANSMVRFHDGDLQNGAAFASGIVGQAFRFDGANGYVRVHDDPTWDFASGSFTIDMWVNFNSVVSQFPHQQPLIGHTEGPGLTNKWIFWLEDGNLTFHINNPSVSAVNPITYEWDPAPGNWYHVAVTRAAHTWKLFIDGREVAATINSRAIPDARVDLTIGKAEETWLDGLLDEVEIYRRALSAEEISAIFRAGSAGRCRMPANIVITSSTTMLTAEKPAPGTILFEEDFEDGLVQGLNYMVGSWEVITDEAGNKVLEGDNRHEPKALSFGLGSPQWSDYAVEYDLKLRNPAANLWLFVRNNNQGFYVQGLSVLYGGTSMFVTSEKNNWDLLKSRTYEFSRGVWYHMRQEVQGETIRVFINEKLELETTDPQHQAGDLAFEVPGPARVQFDNIRVTMLAPVDHGQH